MLHAAFIAMQIFMGIIMVSDNKADIINEILQLRKELRSIAMDETLSDERKMLLIYRRMPTTDEKHSLLYVGDYLKRLDKEDKIGMWTEDLNTTPLRWLINNAPKYVPPQAIMEKFTELIRDNPLDVEAIIHSTNFEGERSEWIAFDYYMDSKLLPPEPGGEYEPLEEHEQQRADEFQRLLKTRSDDFILRFMLLASLGSAEGDYTNVSLNSAEKLWAGEAFIYAEGALYDSFPAWYRQWNKLVPTMCVRSSYIFEQKLCPEPKQE